MMKQCGMQQIETGSGRDENMVCPKPRRLGLLNIPFNDHPVSARSPRWQLRHQAEGADVLDIIRIKAGLGVEQSCTQVASSPPFFRGSPPTRVSNPLIQDARFGDETVSPMQPLSPSSSSRKGSCVRANFGNKPAVRVEGFDCLDRDRRNCSIFALA